MAAYKISTEIILYTDSEDEAWDAFEWIRPDEMRWEIEKIVTNDYTHLLDTPDHIG